MLCRTGGCTQGSMLAVAGTALGIAGAWIAVPVMAARTAAIAMLTDAAGNQLPAGVRVTTRARALGADVTRMGIMASAAISMGTRSSSQPTLGTRMTASTASRTGFGGMRLVASQAIGVPGSTVLAQSLSGVGMTFDAASTLGHPAMGQMAARAVVMFTFRFAAGRRRVVRRLY